MKNGFMSHKLAGRQIRGSITFLKLFILLHSRGGLGVWSFNRTKCKKNTFKLMIWSIRKVTIDFVVCDNKPCEHDYAIKRTDLPL